MNPFQYDFLIILIVALLALQFYLLRKTRRIDLNVWAMKEQFPVAITESFRQLEALQSLYWDLQPVRALPPTRGWAGSPDFLRELASHMLANKPQTVIECSSGASTIVIARCLQLIGQGHVHSLEHAPEYAAATRKVLAQQGLSEWATVIDAPLIETTTNLGKQPWYDLSGLGVQSTDLIVIDGPPESTAPLARYPAGPELLPRLVAGGALFLDDASRPAEREIVGLWLDGNPGFELQRIHCEKGLAVLKKKASR